MADLLVGIDSSTTATKAIAWDRTGRPVAEGRAPIPLSNPAINHYEQDPRDWWDSTRLALKSITAQVDPSRIKAVSISNQRETLGYFYEDGTPARPAQVWLDERARDLFGPLADKIGRDQDGVPLFHKISGKPVDLIPAITRMYWSSLEDPALHDKIDRFCSVHCYLSFMLTGEWVTSWASADPLGVFDMVAKQWSPVLLDAVNIDIAKMPRAERPGTVIGEISPKAAGETGLLAGTPVIAGGGDGQLAGLGCAALDIQSAYLNIGTAQVSGIHGPHYLISPSWRTMGGPTGDGYIYESCIRAGTFTVTWFLEAICGTDPMQGAPLLKQLEAEANAVAPGADGLYLLPYWQGSMAPHWDSSSRGGYIGLTGLHRRGHLFRALMEGLALEQHLCTSAVETALGSKISRFIAIGGGASSKLWRQIFADATGKMVERSDTLEASSLGAAMCAAKGLGWFETFEDAASSMAGRITDVTHPDPVNHARYQEIFTVYRQLYGALQPVFPLMEKLVRET